MEDPILNRNLEETKELQTRWTQFRDFYLAASKGQPVTPQVEAKFLELKSRIAMLHDGLMGGLKKDQKTGMNVMSIVSECILLSRVANTSDAERQKFEFDWNECYLMINDTVGAMEHEKEELAGINEKTWRAEQKKEELRAKLQAFFKHQGTRIGLTGAAILLVLWLIPTLGIFSYTNFGRWGFTKPMYGLVVEKFWRPYINPNLEYATADEIVRAELDSTVIPAELVKDRGIDVNYLRDTEFPSMGVSEALKGELSPMIDEAAWSLGERWSIDGQDVRIYVLLFKDGRTAEQFVNKLVTLMANLNDQQKQSVRQQTYLDRNSNLVMLGRGNHIFRQQYFIETFMISDTRKSLLK